MKSRLLYLGLAICGLTSTAFSMTGAPAQAVAPQQAFYLVPTPCPPSIKEEREAAMHLRARIYAIEDVYESEIKTIANQLCASSITRSQSASLIAQFYEKTAAMNLTIKEMIAHTPTIRWTSSRSLIKTFYTIARFIGLLDSDRFASTGPVVDMIKTVSQLEASKRLMSTRIDFSEL